MKKNAVFIILIISVVSIFVFFTSDKAKIEAAGVSRDTVEKAYGYKVSLIRYDGTGVEQRIGKPFLVYHPDMMKETRFTISAAIPTSHDQLMNSGGAFNLDQVWSNKEEGSTLFGVDFGDEWHAHDERMGQYPVGAVNNPYLDFSGAAEGWENDTKIVRWTNSTIQKYTPAFPALGCSKTPYTCYNAMFVFTFKYMSDTRDVTYKSDMIRYDDDYYTTIPDSNLTEANVNNGSFIERLKSVYLSVTKDNFQKKFGVTINEQDIDKYYFQIEVVQRVLLNEFEDYGSYTVTEFDQDPPYQKGEISKDEWIKDEDTDWCDSPDWRWLPRSCYNIKQVTGTLCRKTEIEYVDSQDYGCMTNYECTRRGGRNIGKRTCTGSYIMCEITTSVPQEKCVQHGTKCTYKGYYLNSPEAYNFGNMQHHVIMGHLSNGWSEIVTSRNYGSDSTFLNRAVNDCNTVDAKHCVLADDGVTCKTPLEYKYYIGPNEEKALVGPNSSYRYQLVGCGFGGSAGGIKHLYAIHVQDQYCTGGKCCKTEVCVDVLKNSPGGNRSDEYLRCAENYCEAYVDYDVLGNSRNRKKNCLLKSCEYSYGVSPNKNPGEEGYYTDPDRESEDSCNNSKNELFRNNIKDLTSTCTKTNLGTITRNEKGVLAESCVGDQVTDFDPDDTNEDPKTFVGRKYINKVCKEEASFNFTDVSKKQLSSAGTGFEYEIEETGNRICKYFINLEQWKFDYASVPRRDPLLRKRLLYILDIYNSENKEKKDMKNYLPDFVEAFGDDLGTYGKTYYEDEGYEFTNTKVNVDIEEKLVNDKIVTPTAQTMVITDVKNIDGEKESVINKTLDSMPSLKTNVSMSTTPSNDMVTVVASNSISYIPVKRYITDAKGVLTFGLQEMCVSTDGNAKVTLAPGNGICGKSATGSDIIAKRWHYTDFKIKLNNSNPVKTKVSVTKTVKYYEDDEQCTYKVTDSSEKCELIVEISEGTMKSSKEMYADNATVKLKHRIASTDITESITDKYKIGNNVQIESSTNNQITVIRRNAEDPHELEGKVRYKDISGTMQEVTCPKKIVLKAKNPTCPFKCELVKQQEDRINYWIKVMDLNGNEITTDLNKYKYSYYINTAAEYDLDKKYRNVVTPSAIDNFKTFIVLKEVLKDDEELNAAVELGGCEAICHVDKAGCKDPCCEGSCKTKNCLKDLKSADTATVYNYCQDPENLKKDMNNFDSSEECFEICSYYPRCEYYGCDKTKAENFCTRFNEYGYTSKNQCMNECYADCSIEEKGQYLFRAVNVLNPFPNSDESDYPFEKGDRIVGSNWREMSEFITSDDDDRTTITGNNANQYVEYIIDLTPSDIRRIRQDTDASELNNEKRKRAVYAKLDRIKTSSNVIGEYKSNFIHNSQFSDSIFKTEHGSTIVLKDDKN